MQETDQFYFNKIAYITFTSITMQTKHDGVNHELYKTTQFTLRGRLLNAGNDFFKQPCAVLS